jgi:sugar O-acyltransferase (sialic acid O-acetyltransferase NeuD family)
MEDRPRQLVIVGAGGLGIEALWTARAMGGWELVGFADDNPAKAGTLLDGEPVVGNTGVLAERFGPDLRFLLAVGDNQVRRQLAATLATQGLRPGTVVHPTARRAPGVEIGAGCYIAPGVTLAPACVLGEHVIVNTNAVIGHECRIGDFTQICPGAIVTGQCRLGCGSYVGSNAALQPGVEVGDWGCVGACSFATTDVAPGQTVMGNPARPMFQRR